MLSRRRRQGARYPRSKFLRRRSSSSSVLSLLPSQPDLPEGRRILQLDAHHNRQNNNIRPQGPAGAYQEQSFQRDQDPLSRAVEKYQLLKHGPRKHPLTQLFQNLIKNTMTRVEEKAVFTKINTHQKYNLADKDELKRLSQRGEDIIYKRKGKIVLI